MASTAFEKFFSDCGQFKSVQVVNLNRTGVVNLRRIEWSF